MGSPRPNKGRVKLTRQERYRRRKIKEGKCTNCGNERPKTSPFVKMCVGCGESKRTAKRIATGAQAWKPNGPGRRPYTQLSSVISSDSLG